MNKQYATTVGSGTIPHVGYGPAHSLTPGSYPGAHSKNELRTRVGDGAVILNPEDFSVSIGLRTSAITVGTSATPLPSNPMEYRRALVVHNNGASTVYLGDENVTVNSGLPLAAGEKIAFDIQGNPNVVVYAISGGSVNVRIMELA
jgi:hypothetical protein